MGRDAMAWFRAAVRLASLLVSLVNVVWTVQRLRRHVYRANRELAERAVAMNVGEPSLLRRLEMSTDQSVSPRLSKAEREAILQLLAADLLGRPDLVANDALPAKAKTAQEALQVAESQLAEIRRSLRESKRPRGRHVVFGGIAVAAIIAGLAMFVLPRSDSNLAIAGSSGTADRAGVTQTVDLANANATTGVGRDLETAMKAAGFSTLSEVELRRYVIYGTLEKYKARADQPLDAFWEADPNVTSSSYVVTLPAGTDEPGFFLFGSGHRSSHLAVRVPFRVQLDTRNVTCTGAIRRIAPYLADHHQAWFLTKDRTLSRCNSPSERMVVVRNNGILYFPENPWFSFVMIEVGFDDVREFVSTDRPRVQLEIEGFNAHKPMVWGFYNVHSLGSEFNRYDCAAIHRSFDVGLDIGDAPGYFANDKLAPSRVVGGVLKKLTLVANDGKVLGTATVSD